MPRKGACFCESKHTGSYSQGAGQDRWKISKGPLSDLVIFGLRGLGDSSLIAAQILQDRGSFFHPQSSLNQYLVLGSEASEIVGGEGPLRPSAKQTPSLLGAFYSAQNLKTSRVFWSSRRVPSVLSNGLDAIRWLY